MRETFHILHIDTERSWRGGEAQVFSLCRGLAGKNIRQFAVANPGAPLSSRLREIGIETFEMPLRGEFDLRAAFRLSRIARERSIDLIHAHDAHAHAISWLATMRRPSIPVVVTRRVDFPVGGNLFSAMKYRSPRIQFIAISGGVKDVLLKGGVTGERVEIVFSGIDPARFIDAGDGSAFKRKYGVKQGEIVIGNIAALTDHKGQVYLVDAAPRVIERFPNARFFIVGEGELRPMLQERIDRLGLGGKMILTGFLRDVGDALAAMDLFVLSSHLEGLCTSLLDAMIMRVPVVATRTGGVPDVVKDGTNGYLAEPRNPEQLADCIIRLLEDRDARSRFVENAYNRVMEHFTTDKMVEGTAAVYRRILG